ncbi:uncharacterized membrane protein YhaH (DUF805 family) [Paucimonas lemoignei]|uniref:Uncharacterized membrane protein YhaH (DUF805 family) n=1 Tax=Paucimonas lemoignei TaxID=29443 RepID=A0A4R3HVV2_PAULE|nr:DUF805 domain-containing protein [Paucimonas lemoignei]TCS37386.1 uncharacterized membrane protein YhaH (DUF805 family) [Paucimonas lemoignei]
MDNPYLAPDAVLTAPAADDITYEPSIFSLHGRIGRIRYLAYSFALSLIVLVIGGVFSAIVVGVTQNPAVAMIVLGIAIYIPSFALAFIMAKRRLNDLDHSGWMSLLMLIPLANVILGLYMVFAAGTPTTNRFGPRPVKNSRAIVIFGLAMPVFFCVIGILAAIAIPAYQSYVMRAKAAEIQQTIRP